MRKILPIHDNWLFSKLSTGEAAEAVTLPHTWNAIDGQDGGNDYYRGTCYYTRQLTKPAINPGDEVWLEFLGAAHTCEVMLNGEMICRHEGGYSTFRVKLENLKENNTLVVSVDSSDNDRVYPQKADFTFYGGLYRGVNLIVVPASHFELGSCGTPGIKVTPVVNLEEKSAVITVETWQTKAESVTMEAAGKTQTVPSVDGYAKAEFTIENVHLWDGIDDPYLYTATATLPSGDSVSTRFGCRKCEIDPQKGFLLNGRSYPLRGGSRHQDCKGVGNALTMEHHRRDMEIIREMAAKDRPHFRRRSICLFHNFPSQSDAYLNAVDKAGLFMIPAEGTDGIDDLVHVSQRHPIQKTVQLMEILFDMSAAAPLQVFIALIQEC